MGSKLFKLGEKEKDLFYQTTSYYGFQDERVDQSQISDC